MVAEAQATSILEQDKVDFLATGKEKNTDDHHMKSDPAVHGHRIKKREE